MYCGRIKNYNWNQSQSMMQTNKKFPCNNKLHDNNIIIDKTPLPTFDLHWWDMKFEIL